MDYYQKYLKSLNNFNYKGGADNAYDPSFYTEAGYKHYPNTWNIQNNQFYRWPLILQLLKLSYDTIQKQIIKDADQLKNFIDCIFINIGAKDNDLKKYNLIYDTHLKKKVVYPAIPGNKTDYVYVRDLINYFTETHEEIDHKLAVNNNLVDEDTQKSISEHLKLCSDLYVEWRKRINIFYGRPEDEVFKAPGAAGAVAPGAAAAAPASGAAKVPLYNKLHEKETRQKINNLYKQLTETAIITYLKIRCDKNPEYNERFNLFLEPMKEDSKSQSVYITGPNPNIKKPFYAGKNASLPGFLGTKSTPTFKNLIPNEIGNLAMIKQYEYGYLLGPFTKIFPPELTNKEIADKSDEIIKKFMIDKNSVFIIGYGASGAGKTTALILNKNEKPGDPKRDGLLLQLLKSEKFKEIDEITLSVHELYAETEDNNKNPIKESREYNNIIFKRATKAEAEARVAAGAAAAVPAGAVVPAVEIKSNIIEGNFYIKNDLINNKKGEYKEVVRKKISDEQYKLNKRNIFIDELSLLFSLQEKIVNKLLEIAKLQNVDDVSKQPNTQIIKTIKKILSINNALKIKKNATEGYFFSIKDLTTETDNSKFDQNDKNILYDAIDNIIETDEFTKDKIIISTVNVEWKEEKYGWQVKDGIFSGLKENSITNYDPRIILTGDEWENQKIELLSSNLGDYKVEKYTKIEMYENADNYKVNKIISRKVPMYKLNVLPTTIPDWKQDRIGKSEIGKYTFNPSYDDDKLKYDELVSADEIEANFKPISKEITELGEYILTLVDRIRMVNPTTNNPNSSRSHVLIYIKTNEGNVLRNLIVGDLAGKENKFICDEAATQKQFLDIRSVNRIDGSQGTEPHYTVNTNIMVRKIEFGTTSDQTNLILDILTYLQYDEITNTIGDMTKSSGTQAYQHKMKIINLLMQININATDDDIVYTDEVAANGATLYHYNIESLYPGLKIVGSTLVDSGTLLADGTKKMNKYKIMDGKYIKKLATAVFDNIKEKKGNYKNAIEFVEALQANTLLISNNLDYIVQNIEAAKRSGVVKLCTDRRIEGSFINRSLGGIENSITDLVHQLNESDAGTDEGVLKNIPLVKEPCFKFFCNQNDISCFQQLKDDEKVETYIFNDIKEMIGIDDGKGKKIDSKKLTIAIFGVLNLNRNTNDPVKIPFTDLNKTLEARNKFLTYKFYNQETKQNSSIQEIVLQEYLGITDKTIIGKPVAEILTSINKYLEDQKILTKDKKSILEVLNEFKIEIGEDLLQDPINLVAKILAGSGSIFDNLLKLIKKIKIINSISVLGTMFFLNDVKNAYTTDLACSLIANDEVVPNIETENIDDYQSVVPLQINNIRLKSDKLSEMIYHQIQINKSADNIPTSNNTESSDPHISPEYVVGGSYINNYIGGYLSKLQSINKKELVNEYNRLKKMYKNKKY